MMRRTGRWVLAVVAALVLAIALAPCLTRRPDEKSVVCEDELRRHVGFLTGIEPPRNYRNPASLERIAVYVEDHFRACGLRLENQIFRVDGTEYRNVIGTAGPRDGPRLVVGAHYDVEGENPGADDNASGVAGLLELARWVGDLSPHLEKRLDLVAYSLEEPPFFRTQEMGSHAHAAALRDQGVEVAGMICLEMIGYFSGEEGSQSYPLAPMKFLYGERGDFIAVVSNLEPPSVSLLRSVADAMQEACRVRVERLSIPAAVPGVDFSDHLNYWKHGFPAVMVTDTAFYRNPNYHEPTDTAETLDYTSMAQVVRGLYHAVLRLQEESEAAER